MIQGFARTTESASILELKAFEIDPMVLFVLVTVAEKIAIAFSFASSPLNRSVHHIYLKFLSGSFRQSVRNLPRGSSISRRTKKTVAYRR
jgi:hypothetical protein